MTIKAFQDALRKDQDAAFDPLTQDDTLSHRLFLLQEAARTASDRYPFLSEPSDSLDRVADVVHQLLDREGIGYGYMDIRTPYIHSQLIPPLRQADEASRAFMAHKFAESGIMYGISGEASINALKDLGVSIPDLPKALENRGPSGLQIGG